MSNLNNSTDFSGVYEYDLQQKFLKYGPIHKIPMDVIEKILEIGGSKFNTDKIERIKERLEYLFWEFSTWQTREGVLNTKRNVTKGLSKIGDLTDTLIQLIQDTPGAEQAISRRVHRSYFQDEYKKPFHPGTEPFPPRVYSTLDHIKRAMKEATQPNNSRDIAYNHRIQGRCRKELNTYLIAFWKIELGQDAIISVNENSRALPPSSDMNASKFVHFIHTCHAYLGISHATGSALKTALIEARKSSIRDGDSFYRHLFAPLDWR